MGQRLRDRALFISRGGLHPYPTTVPYITHNAINYGNSSHILLPGGRGIPSDLCRRRRTERQRGRPSVHRCRQSTKLQTSNNLLAENSTIHNHGRVYGSGGHSGGHDWASLVHHCDGCGWHRGVSKCGPVALSTNPNPNLAWAPGAATIRPKNAVNEKEKKKNFFFFFFLFFFV